MFSCFDFGSRTMSSQTTGTLLLTWSCWWVRIIGPAVPARRPFFRPADSVPELARAASNYTDEDIYVYTLAGGWPTFNSVVRICASSLALISSFSFAIIAIFATHQTSRRLFSIVFLIIAIISLAAAICDTVAIATAGIECAKSACLAAVPDVVKQSDVVCKCAVEGWFYLTLLADVILLVSSVVCFILVVKPAFAASVAYPT